MQVGYKDLLQPIKGLVKSFLLSGLLVAGTITAVFSQATFTNNGFWNTATNWSGSNIGDALAEDVTINASRTALINNGFSYTIGNLTFGNSAALTINATGSLNVGDSGNPRNLIGNNGATISVTGTLIVWGNLVVNNNLTLSVSGTMIVKGNVLMNNGASLSVTGSVDIDGNFTGENNTNVTIIGAGAVNVDGVVDVGMNSNLTGPVGSFTAGSCIQGGGSTFCTSSALPVELLFFKVEATTYRVKLSWSTASELNSDYFRVEKSDDGLTYKTLSQVESRGNSAVRVNYETVDEKPTVGRAYYRLKQVDLDGKETMYQVVLFEFIGLRNSSVYPNPLQQGDNLTLELNFIPSVPLEVLIVDLSGKTIERLSLSGSSATFSVQLNTGMYLVKIASPEYQSISKFIVR